MNFIKGIIERLNPRYLSQFRPMIESIAQFQGGVENEKFENAKFFSNTYEFYIYAFFIGLANDKLVTILPDDKAETFWSMDNWKPKELTNQIVVCAIAKSNFDMSGIEHMQETEARIEVQKILKTIEGYANGGLQIIQDLKNSDPETFEDDMFPIRLLKQAGK